MRINKLLEYRATSIEESNKNLSIYKLKDINSIY